MEAIALTDAFGVTGPAHLPCLPLRFHVGQKLHGMTLPPRPGKQNERFRDCFYASRLPGEPDEGVEDIHTHPALPRSVRLGVRFSF